MRLTEPSSVTITEPSVPVGRASGETCPDSARKSSGRRDSGDRAYLLGLAAVLMVGFCVRVVPWRGFGGEGFDEYLYEGYVHVLSAVGLSRYPDIVDAYVDQQSQLPDAVLPPTRFLYIFCGYLWKTCFHTSDLSGLRAVSTLFQVLNLALAAVAGTRMGGKRVGLVATALVSCSPLQIHFAQHALIDGFFAFWATLTVWCLWECLQQPADRLWHILFPAAFALTVVTKENAFFVGVAILGLLILNRWARFGTVTRRLVLVTALGGVSGVLILSVLSGGVGPLVQAYVLLVTKAHHLRYAQLTGDGPWYRYFVELLAVSPLTFLLAVGTVFGMRRSDRPALYLCAYIAGSFAVMCNVKYGMNLRYTTIWDLPLRFLAAWQVVRWARQTDQGRWRGWVTPAAVLALCSHDLFFYQHTAVRYPLYELAPNEFFRALDIVKPGP